MIPEAPPPIGQSVPRRDGGAKVTGAAKYTGDLALPGMCHARVVRSPYAHARIRSIDVSQARRVPGVVAVVTAADLADVNLLFGHAVRDHPLIAADVVRFAGEPVVGVVAEDSLAAEEAAELVFVDYEPLPYVTDARAALAEDAPAVHVGDAERAEYGGETEAITTVHPNLCTRMEHGWGDIDAAFEGAALILDDTYEYPMAYAYAMEPYTTIASFDDEGLSVITSGQHAFLLQAELARCFNLSLSKVRVSIPHVGGAYGTKAYAKIEPLTAALALRARRPVRLALSVEETILTGRSIPATIRVRTAFDADGRIRGRRATAWLNAGAYAENTPRLAARVARRLSGPYRIPAASVEALVIYTNTVPGASYRGLGAPQAVFAGESQFDEAASRLEIDPLDLRRLNLLERGERAWPAARGMDSDLADDVRLASELIGWNRGPADRGLGVALAASDAGAEPTSSCVMRLVADGSVVVQSGSTELGQGASTALAQIAAAELGVPFEKVRIVMSDTALVPYDRSTGASRTTTVMGLAIQRAGADIREQLLAWARELYAPGDGDLVEEHGGIRIGAERYPWNRIVEGWFGTGAGEVIGRGYVRDDGVTKERPLFWEVALSAVDLTVDDETGEITVNELAAVADVGRAVNPLLMKGQDVGAAMMGLGVALRESLEYRDGTLINGNLYEYRVPRTTDTPVVRSVHAERADGVGPYGIKGGGEGSLNPVAPAVANAIYRATGARIRTAPFTPERVWRAIREVDQARPE